MREEPEDGGYDPIDAAVRQARAWNVILRPAGPGVFSRRIDAARIALRRFEREIASLGKEPAVNDAQAHPLWQALREIRSNPRLLRSAVSSMSVRMRDIARLPRVAVTGKPEEPRACAMAAAYLSAADGCFAEATFSGFVQKYQEHEFLNVDELWLLADFLRFVLLETILLTMQPQLHSAGMAQAQMLPVLLKSLRAITDADLNELIEPLIPFNPLLAQDPARAYQQMDFESRELYRRRIAYVARYSDHTEVEVAGFAADLARKASVLPTDNARMQLRRSHVGYFLIDEGFPQLARSVGFHPPVFHRFRGFVLEHGEDFFITGIQLLTLFTLAVVLFPVLPWIPTFTKFIVATALLLLSATQGAVDLVNGLIASLFDPHPLPKLDFSHGILSEYATLVAVPTLLLNERQVRGLVNDLEVRYLANRDPNLHFVLLTDLADSVSKPREDDSHPLVDLAARLIDELNRKYGSAQRGSFLLLHRHRVFNARQGVWMGWERKRGKLLDLNKLLMGEYDAFPIKVGRTDALRQIRYIITLDSDTELPRDAAARLIGAMAHPLNQAIVDPKRHIVTAGYGILQPRVDITVRSAARSRLAAIFSGQNGFDVYSRAISDPYQDLFGEGIFTGKGIYDVATLHAVLDRRFPRNALLSHDLIEGAYARAGLVTDTEIVDDYPSHYSAYTRRAHRWVRGDWQIAQWMFSHVPNEAGKLETNPISVISRWKILDNLRRSLVDPFLFILFVAGWLWMPGGPLYWTIVPLVLLAVPAFVPFCFGLGRALVNGRKGHAWQAFSALGHTLLLTLLRLVFLPHQTLLALDAIIRSLVRVFITGERLLEWETAAQAEQRSGNRSTVDRYLTLIPLIVLCLGAVVWFFAPDKRAIFCAAPILLLWGLTSVITAWLDSPLRERKSLTAGDRRFLLEHALLVWRYFYQFASERHHHLIPDNVEEEGLFEAARVSPTNIGLLLNARQAACELGFITIPEFAGHTQKSLATIAELEKYRGHLYNWYNTETLEPLDANPFVSSVDSGNFLASLYTLHAGAKELLQKPLLSTHLFSGLHAHWHMMQKENRQAASLVRVKMPALSASAAAWLQWLPAAEEALSGAATHEPYDARHSWWREETLKRIRAIRTLVRDYLPWLLPEFAETAASPKSAVSEMAYEVSVQDAIDFAEALAGRLNQSAGDAASGISAEVAREEFRFLLMAAIDRLRVLCTQLSAIAECAERYAQETDFVFLVHPRRRILSIGYDVRRQQIHEACYDMVASEARIATFLAIARGDLPQQSWLRLGRDHAHAYGSFLLYSWSGTMFEYLMPSLWMQSYPQTLIGRTQQAIIHVQRRFAQSLGTPWGISESGNARRDDGGHYQYHAFGIPDVSLWCEATPGPVISPYSSFLALGTNPLEALRNLRRMESARWVGAFGYYEAADYSQSPRSAVLVREWMAHHQGMSLLAVTNVLANNVVQRWFHENPLVQTTELLLHEAPQSKAVLRARLQECMPIRTA